jgi:hypothetical protein
MLIAPMGSGKTKFIFDLALFKRFRVVYLDLTKLNSLLNYVENRHLKAFDDHVLSLHFTGQERYDMAEEFKSCLSQAASIFEQFLKWVGFIADCVIESTSPEEFLHFWIENYMKLRTEY